MSEESLASDCEESVDQFMDMVDAEVEVNGAKDLVGDESCNSSEVSYRAVDSGIADHLADGEISDQIADGEDSEQIPDGDGPEQIASGEDSQQVVDGAVIEEIVAGDFTKQVEDGEVSQDVKNGEDNEESEAVCGDSFKASTDDDSFDSLVAADAIITEEEVQKSSESFEGDLNEDVATPKTNRELKSLLELTKEAKLDAILTPRRKTLDNSAKSNSSGKKTVKITNFPVTAESELENHEGGDEKNAKKLVKKNKNEVSGIDGAADAPSRKTSQSFSANLAMFKPNKDMFCWRCHHDGVNVACETCPRAYHQKCLKQTIVDTEHWPCPECVAILKAENTQSRSKAMKGMTLQHLCSLLKFAVRRMIQCDGSEPFVQAVDEKQFPEYKNYIIQPMNLTMLEKNIKENLYGSPQAFEADAKWILHNSIIFNSCRDDTKGQESDLLKKENLPRNVMDQSKLTTSAKTILKICKQEMAEIENCPSCYKNANTKKHTWFVEVCPKPHLLVWAKLKGFPYWPAKVMSFNSSGMVDVRFFGAHDKAWVSVKDCYMYSLKDPNASKQKRNDIMECVKELEVYVENLRKEYGRVNYAPFKTPLEAGNEQRFLKLFLPSYHEGGKEKEVGKEMPTISNVSEKETSPGDYGDAPKLIQFDDEGEGRSESEESTKSFADTSTDKTESTPKEIPKTRIEFRHSGGKPKWVVKPLKTVVIRKRHSLDNVMIPRKLMRRSSTKSDSSRAVVVSSGKKDENSASSKETDETAITDSSPLATKLKITHQLIKKLADLDTSEEVPKKDEEKVEVEEAKTEKPVQKEAEQVESQENGNKSDQDKPLVETAGEIEDKSAKENDKNVGVTEVIDVDERSQEESVDLDLDEANIRSIIHSSLVSSKTVPEEPQPEPEKKRKRVEEADKDKNSDTFPPNKMVKLVPIENILQKKPATEENAESSKKKPGQFIVLKEIRVVKDGSKSNSNKSDVVAPIAIKNEAGSDDDSDMQYMEAKRQYMSALNISEKQKKPAKPKSNEIRTRSKTEEKRTKPGDSYLKVIDDVATSTDTEVRKTAPQDEAVKEIYIKSLSKMQAPKHKARKSFPTPNYAKRAVPVTKILPKPKVATTATPPETYRVLKPSPFQTIPLSNSAAGSLVFLPKLHYTKPPPATVDAADSTITVVPRLSTHPIAIPCPPLRPSSATAKDVDETQNYIPQGEPSSAGHTTGLLNNLLIGGVCKDGEATQSNPVDNELAVLKEILPENISKGVNEILCAHPPKLKPKPFGVVATVAEAAAVPSSAGPVTARVNCVAQKLGDFFRGLLVETISDLGKTNNPEATISSLKLEIEELNHQHAIELSEIRRNVSIVLKDIQKSVIEERERIINETKANCEMETLKRVEEAKSKQWCANCSKEAQFYCCWNTSYCDYPCQQKHWMKHMNKCTQTASQNQATAATTRSPGQQLLLTPTTAPKFGTLFAKPQKVYLKRASAPFKQQSAGSHITLVESTPGNFELVGSGPIAVNGKILASTSVIEKIKSGNIVTVTAPSCGTSTESTSANPKVTITAKSPKIPVNSTVSEH